MLTKNQTAAADALKASRPPVIPGTNAIINADACRGFYTRVNDAMKDLGIDTSQLVNEFCDRAGVPD
jgi:hypothetical protein